MRQREQRILALLQGKQNCTVEELAHACGVSDMTIRRDLQRLAEIGQVIRTHGGAAPVEQVRFEFQFLQRSKVRRQQKDAIGARAARLVEDGQSVMLDSGTTTLAMSHHLRLRRRLVVITTSLPIASVVQAAPGVETLLLGGFVRRDSPDLAGSLAEANLERLRADLAFVGADGIDLDGNVYNASLDVARMLERMVQSAGGTYVVADSSKIGRTAMARFGNAAAWRGLITDGEVTPEQLTALRKAGVNVLVAGEVRNGSEVADGS
jgi:DeoR/GlpR family transcriptional regulator of sugar metabolism